VGYIGSTQFYPWVKLTVLPSLPNFTQLVLPIGYNYLANPAKNIYVRGIPRVLQCSMQRHHIIGVAVVSIRLPLRVILLLFGRRQFTTIYADRNAVFTYINNITNSNLAGKCSKTRHWQLCRICPIHFLTSTTKPALVRFLLGFVYVYCT